MRESRFGEIPVEIRPHQFGITPHSSVCHSLSCLPSSDELLSWPHCPSGGQPIKEIFAIPPPFNPITALREWIYPSVCPLCRLPADESEGLCPGCRQNLVPNDAPCPRCSNPTAGGLLCGRCLGTRSPLSKSTIPFLYQPPLVELIHRYKYHKELPLARILGQLFISGTPTLNPSKTDLLVPVPLHRSRIRERGFNQSVELARVIGRQLNIPVDTRSVRRIRATPPQAELPLARRRINIKGAFHCRTPLKAKSVAIIDDVVTSGATVESLGGCLEQAGIETVAVWALARA